MILKREFVAHYAKDILWKNILQNISVFAWKLKKTTMVPARISFDALRCSGKYSDDYKKQILNSFWEDDCGKFCWSDTYIKEYGFYCYRSVVTQKDKVQQKLTTIKQNMGTLTKLFMYCKAEAAGDNDVVTSSLDMFKCDHFQYFRDAINIMFAKEDGWTKVWRREKLRSPFE